MSRFYFEISQTFAWYNAELPPMHIGSPVQTPGLDVEKWERIYKADPEWKVGGMDEMPNWALVDYLTNLVHPDTRQRDNTTWRTKTGLSGNISIFPGCTIYGIRRYRGYNINGHGVVKNNDDSPLSYAEGRKVLLEAINATISYNKEVLLP